MLRTARTAALSTLALLLLLSLAASCDDEDSPEDDELMDTYEITVTDGGIDPLVIEVRVPDVAELTVTNEGEEPCTFFLGPWVRRLDVEGGSTEQIEFSTTEVDESPDEHIPFGCQDSAERQGTVQVLPQLGTASIGQ